MDNYTTIDLFSGAGGLSLGFEDANFKNVFSIDFEKYYCETYKFNFPNHKLIEKDITKLSDNEILLLTKNKKIDVVIGGPPCQGFSMAGNIGRNFIDDPRNHLFKEFSRVVSLTQPKIFIMENVARLFTHNKRKTKEEIIKTFEFTPNSTGTDKYNIDELMWRHWFIHFSIQYVHHFTTNTENNFVEAELLDLET